MGDCGGGGEDDSGEFIIVFIQFQIVFELPQTCMTESTVTLEATHKKTTDFRIKYKTEKCRYLVEKGYCPYSTSCTFAHSDQEIREKLHLRDNYKTKPCLNFSAKGYCPYGSRCHYIHQTHPQKQLHPEGQKTRSNSAESDCSRSTCEDKTNNKLWSRMTHNKRIELIQTLGFDYSIRTSSRLLQLLRSNLNVQPQFEEWMFEEAPYVVGIVGKKYSL